MEHRQANMDYSLSQALKNTNNTGVMRIIVIYDIMCQYFKRLNARVEESQYLMLPFGVALLCGIGLFHVGGHVWQCFSRFSPSFISGAGQVDGEILESLWSVLNEISPSTQNASLAARTETLDDHMGDSNFKKLLDIGENICIYITEVLHVGWYSCYDLSTIQNCGSRRGGKPG